MICFPIFIMHPLHYFNAIFRLHKSVQSSCEDYFLCSMYPSTAYICYTSYSQATQLPPIRHAIAYFLCIGTYIKKKLSEHISNSFFLRSTLTKILLYASKYIKCLHFALYFWQFGNDKPNIFNSHLQR